MKQYVGAPFVPRATCYRCFRPASLCYCGDLPSIANRTRVIIVQHPRERFHPLNTARIAEFGLRSSLVVRVRPQEIESALKQHGVSDDAAILFPSDDAEDLASISPEKRPKEIVLIDGTWSHAKNLLRDIEVLRRYRRVKFTPPGPSAYLIRKEPRADYLSTIESIVHVLQHIEPETEGVSELNTAFVRMIERNVKARIPSEIGKRCRQKTRSTFHRFPGELMTPQRHLVIAYCEGTSRFSAAEPGRGAQAKEPLVVYLRRAHQETATRLLLKTTRTPPDRLLRHLALGPEDLADGMSPESAASNIRRELGPKDVLVVWNTSSRQILAEIGVSFESALVLKGIYCDFLTYRARKQGHSVPQAWGGMQDMIDGLAVPFELPLMPGRGVRRLQQTAALLGWIREIARDHCGPPGS